MYVIDIFIIKYIQNYHQKHVAASPRRCLYKPSPETRILGPTAETNDRYELQIDTL